MESMGYFDDLVKPNFLEPLTPYKLAVYLLVETHVIDGPPTESTMEAKKTNKIAPFLFDLIRGQGLDLDAILCRTKHTLPHIIQMPKFCKRLKNFLSMDLQLTPADELMQLPEEIAKNSVLGLFLRKVYLSMHKLSLMELYELQEVWKENVDSSEMLSQINFNPEISEEVDKSMGVSMEETNEFSIARILEPLAIDFASASRPEVLSYSSKQIHLLLFNLPMADSFGEIERVVSTVKQRSSEFFEIYYLQFVNAIRVRDLRKSEEALRNYFDWSSLALFNRMRAGQSQLRKNFSTASRYEAPVLIAQLYRLFGKNELAATVLEDCVGKIKESGDILFQAHILTEYARLASPPEKAVGMLELALRREKILSSDEQNENHDSDSAAAIKKVRSLHRQAHIQACRRGFAGGQPLPELINQLQEGVLEAEDEELISCRLACISSLFLSQGSTETALNYAQELLGNNFPDTHCNFKATQPYCIALCNIAYVHTIEGDFEAALGVLDQAKKTFPDDDIQSCHWKVCEASLEFQRMLFEGTDVTMSAQCVSVFQAWAPSEAELIKAKILSAKSEHEAALKILSRHRHLLAQESHVSQLDLSKCLLELAEEHLRIGDPCESLQLTEEALSASKRGGFGNLTALAHLARAAAELEMGRTSVALRIMDEHEPNIRSRCGQLDRSRLLVLKAKCILTQLRGQANASAKEGLQNVLKLLSDALKGFEKLNFIPGRRDLFYLMAHLYEEAGDKEKRNYSAKLFREIHQECPQAINGVFDIL